MTHSTYRPYICAATNATLKNILRAENSQCFIYRFIFFDRSFASRFFKLRSQCDLINNMESQKTMQGIKSRSTEKNDASFIASKEFQAFLQLRVLFESKRSRENRKLKGKRLFSDIEWSIEFRKSLIKRNHQLQITELPFINVRWYFSDFSRIYFRSFLAYLLTDPTNYTYWSPSPIMPTKRW